MAISNHAFTTYNHSRVPASGQFKNEFFQEQVLWKLLLLTAIAYIMWSDKISIVLGPVSTGEYSSQPGGERVRATLFDFSIQRPEQEKQFPEVGVEVPPGALNNVTFAMDPAFALRNKVKKTDVEERVLKCKNYAERFAPLAVAEMHKFGIPASVTLAQALLESNAGESRLAESVNNHFGIKCFSKRCKRGHCANFTDDSHKDFFVKYATAWGSFRAHSQFIKKGSRYRHLFELGTSDYRNWANGLAEAGYATDKKYGAKLIAIIQMMGLDRYDRM
ncbi:MAG: glucosaminidase domain-containing protein [Lewinellaceae bacterium]|nr:glucosaminidase domain-containing protein [Lewinellaceae bacterium]